MASSKGPSKRCKSKRELQTACVLPKMPGLPRLWEHLLRSSLSPGHPYGTGQRQMHRASGFVTWTQPGGKGEEDWEAVPEAFTAPAFHTTQHCRGLKPLYGAQGSLWSCFCKSRRPPLHPTVAEASHSLVSASQRQGAGSGQCHPLPVPCQRRRL